VLFWNGFLLLIFYSKNTFCYPYSESPKIIKDNSSISKNVGVQEEKLKGAGRNTLNTFFS